MTDGWIKLHRQVQDCWVWDEDEKFDKAHAWVDLLLLANHRDKKIAVDGKPMVITRGQFLTSIVKLSARWNWDRKTTTKFLNILENDGMLELKKTNRWTTITIVNYSIYQGSTDNCLDNSMDNSMDSTTDNSMDTNKNIKNVKNDKERKNIYGEFKHVKLTTAEYDKLAADFGEAKRDEAIKFLDEYIEEKGYKSKSHNMAMRRWVFDAVDRQKGSGTSGNGRTKKFSNEIVGNTEDFSNTVTLW